MKIRITESQLKFLLEEENVITDKILSIYKNIKNILSGNIKMYKTVIPGIADDYYGKESVKSDAFRHILAAAFFTTTIGDKFTLLGGELNELGGALKNFLKGEGFDSGWVMDSKNNKLGIIIGNKNPKSDINQLSKVVKNLIDSGNFYTKKGILFKKDPNPEK
jgi:hypothetical protein